MPEIVKTKQLKDKAAHSCEIIVIKDGEEYKLAEGRAVVKAAEKSTILHTNKYKYPYVERIYSVVFCNICHFNYEPTIEFMQGVEQFNIKLTFTIDGAADKDILIRDAEPKRIAPAGDWEFALTEREGEKIAQIGNGSTQWISY